MPDQMKYLIDAGAGAALFVALMLVFVVDRFFLSGEPAKAENTLLGVNVIENKAKGDGKRLKLAVTETGFTPSAKNPLQKELWDDMGKLLKELGWGDLYSDITEQDLLSKKKRLSDYDVVFLTCKSGGEELNDQLRGFVAEGGILYASDWRYDAIARAFPDMVDEKTRAEGEKGEVRAEVVDPALRDMIGSSITLKFDLPAWKTAGFLPSKTKILMQGNYSQRGGGAERAPLMVKFGFGKGTVIFTSFHNEKQNSRVEKQLLQYLVFSLVTAGIDAEVSGKMEEGGFKPQRSNLLSTPAKNQSTDPKTYENKKKTTLRFVLGFRNEGAKMRFNIKSPSGLQYTWDGQSTVILEVADAEIGNWTYTVTALDLPYENFPFTVTVGEKK